MIVFPFSACSSYRPQRLKTPFVEAGHVVCMMNVQVCVHRVAVFKDWPAVGYLIFHGVEEHNVVLLIPAMLSPETETSETETGSCVL